MEMEKIELYQLGDPFDIIEFESKIKAVNSDDNSPERKKLEKMSVDKVASVNIR